MGVDIGTLLQRGNGGFFWDFFECEDEEGCHRIIQGRSPFPGGDRGGSEFLGAVPLHAPGAALASADVVSQSARWRGLADQKSTELRPSRGSGAFTNDRHAISRHARRHAINPPPARRRPVWPACVGLGSCPGVWPWPASAQPRHAGQATPEGHPPDPRACRSPRGAGG